MLILGQGSFVLEFFKRVFTFFIVSFCFLNALVFFILNSQTIQHAIIEYINSNYLNKQNLNLSIGSLGLNLFTGNINLNEVNIVENDPKKNQLFFKTNQLSVSFNLGLTYLKRKPVINKIFLRGSSIAIPYDKKGNLLLPEFLNSDEETNISKLIKEDILNIPFDLILLNSNVILGNKNTKNYQDINITQLEIKRVLLEHSKKSIELTVLSNDTELSFEKLPLKIKISSLQTDVSLNQEGNIALSKVELKSNIASLNSAAKISINDDFQKSKYSVNILNLEVYGKEALKIVDFNASGKAFITGKLISNNDQTLLPVFTGKLRWENFKIEQFILSDGKADLTFKNNIINYTNASIITKNMGEFSAEGKFELFNNFSFENYAIIKNIKLSDMLTSLGVNNTPIDSDLKCNNLKVSGNIFSKDPKKGFEIKAEADIDFKNSIVLSFDEQNKRSPIPSGVVNLKLNADQHRIVFDNSLGFFKKDSKKIGSMTINSGYIDFDSPKGVKSQFNLSAQNLDISSLDYFLKFPTNGIANFTGDLSQAEGSSNLYFKCVGSIQRAEIFGIKYKSLIGNWGIDPDGVWAKNAIAIMSHENSEKQSIVNISLASIKFDNLYTKLIATASGELNGIMQSIVHWVPKQVSEIAANITSLSIDLEGPLLKASKWDLKLISQLENFVFLKGYIKNATIKLNSINGNYSKSSVTLFGIKNIEKNAHTNLKEEENTSFALLTLSNVSPENAYFQAKLNEIPIDIFNDLHSNTLTGTISSNFDVTGKWKNLAGSANILARNITYNSFALGDFDIQAISSLNNMISLNMRAFHNQLFATYKIPQGLEGLSTLNVNLTNFNPTLFLPSQVRVENNLFSQISGSFILNSMLPFNEKTSSDWYTTWTGKGSINYFNFEIGKTIFVSENEMKLNFDKKNIQISKLNFIEKREGFSKINIDETEINLAEKLVDSSLSLYFDLSRIDKVFDFIGSSDGDINGNISIKGMLFEPDFIGYLRLKGKSLLIKNYSPELKNLEGNIVLKNKTIEIQSFNASKGDGALSAVGSIDYSSGAPNVSVDIFAKNIDLRFPIPIFQIADSTLDANFSVTGNSFPYSLSGDVNIKKLRMFRDIKCNEIGNEILNQNSSNFGGLSTKPIANLAITMRSSETITVQSQCVRGRFSITPNLNITGDTSSPLLNGELFSNFATLNLLKTHFDVKQADIKFSDIQKYDPNVNIRMESKVSFYTLYLNINGKLSTAKLDLSISPKTLPNGDRITQADIISIISTGQIPSESNSVNLLSASSDVFSFLGVGSVFRNTLDNTVSTVTVGLVDTLSITPTTQNGQVSWRASLSRSVSDRLNLGVSYEDGVYGTTQSAYATFNFNDTISAIVSGNRSSLIQQIPTSEYFGGLRFRFGSE